MRAIITLCLLTLSIGAAAAPNLPRDLQLRCAREGANDPRLHSNDFHWNFSLPEMIEKFREIYSGAKRLPDRAYWDENRGSLMLPFGADRGGHVELPYRFVLSVIRHVETAFRNDYIDGLFFPDMGHSHFLIPEAKYAAEYRNSPVKEMSKTYNRFFHDPELLVVYHTAEQLRMTDDNSQLLPDRRLQWRFFSRNLVGDNRAKGELALVQNPTHKHNTTGGLPGYYWWGAGFNISANEKGCIAYERNGRIEYFDLSLEDLKPEGGGADYQSSPVPNFLDKH
ncbi:MAG: hypothetical protein KF767_15035 [Bdellovibrionaceae bacterium]|nr:hypothetical protein [Pseudobdellovibrionaceae bacterium]